MGFYFADHQSMFAQVGMNVEKTLDAITRRYRGQHPPHPPAYRPYFRGGIMRGKDYRYEADFTKDFPKAAFGTFVYAWGRIWSDGESEIKFDVSCVCPTLIYSNRELIFRSTIFEERDPEIRHSLVIKLKAGWNHLVLRFEKTRGGFGGVFGTWLGKQPYYFLMPSDERGGQEGWLYSEPQKEALSYIPGEGMTEANSSTAWLPEQKWSKSQLAMGQCRRIFGLVPGASAIGWARASFLRTGLGKYSLRGKCVSPISITIADAVVFSTSKSGKFSASIEVPFGLHDVMVKSECQGKDWGFELSLSDGSTPVPFCSPCNLQGNFAWIYAGPFAADQGPNLARLRDLNKLVPAIGGDTYWHLDAPDTWVRPYNENALYGRWNYPLGVTVYGLLHSARAIASVETQHYLVNHIKYCCDIFDYALWDRKQYGGATNVHHLLTSIDSLDDCGSFGSSALEMAKYFEIPGIREISDYVADYITNKQIRLPDGTFFRKHLMHTFHEDTLWADDLYMSVPFLCRYYQLTRDQRYVDDAARQFIGFKKYLYIPEWKLMAHVYDFKRQLATGVPWGRGNGWVIFSLSELLAVLPSDHELRSELLDMFRDLCSGYLAQQDEKGMWHQVLNEHDSYPETSCTSMITYAFARGVQFGWLEDNEPYVRSVFKAWEALNRTSIDRQGNVHGVCRGSEFSFTSNYYKKELLWNLNDTHGIGIVLLAGVEVLRLTTHLQTSGLPIALPSSKAKAPAKPARARRSSASLLAASD